MRKFIIVLFIGVFSCVTIMAQKVTVYAVDQPASIVFRNIMEQTGKNFIYPSELLRSVKVNINVSNQPLKKVLDKIFRDTDISYKIKGKNVILKKEKKKEQKSAKINTSKKLVLKDTIKTTILKEYVVFPQSEPSVVETLDIGFTKLSSEEIKRTPTILGEPDIIRTLHTQPGITEGIEGIAGMYVDGGNLDENLFILDHIPIYQTNHFGGLFSAFNPDIIKNIDFYKTSIPAKFDSRLSSFTNVELKKGIQSGHHGSAKLGLTSGAFNISGPIGEKTTYLFGLRRSWYDVLTIPIFAIINAKTPDQKTNIHYYFTDLNGKISHRFSSKLSAFVSAYYGNDFLKAIVKDDWENDASWYDQSHANFNWGNLVVNAGLNYRILPNLYSEYTFAFNQYFSSVKNSVEEVEITDYILNSSSSNIRSSNNIKDWIFKSDFEWDILSNLRSEFGLGYTRHIFRPNQVTRDFIYNGSFAQFKTISQVIGANEGNGHFNGDWKISENLRIDAGLHASFFNIEDKTHWALSPRASISFRPSHNFAIKGAYSHTVQYVHQIARSYLSLPTDQWIPITGDFKPATADKIALGGYWQSNNKLFEISLEAYYKKMDNLLDYRDEFYLLPPVEIWSSQLTSGSGDAKGISLKLEKKAGKFTGQASYTLSWSDRLFKYKNGGKRFPSRFDNRHTINININWDVSEKVSLSAIWVGHSGNRFTLLAQSFSNPNFDSHHNMIDWGIPLKSGINNYQLPFYHRLDLSCVVNNKHGYWNFGLYNAYCHMNTVAIVRDSEFSLQSWENNSQSSGSIPVFKKLKLFPIIPSVSYTWVF